MMRQQNNERLDQYKEGEMFYCGKILTGYLKRRAEKKNSRITRGLHLVIQISKHTSGIERLQVHI